jgi:hypothetical protein
VSVLLVADAARRPLGGAPVAPPRGRQPRRTPMSTLALLPETLGRSWTGVEGQELAGLAGRVM